MATRNDIPIELVNQYLLYDKDTGVFYWRKSNKEAGWADSNGYVFIRLKGKLYRAHRLAYAITYGMFDGEIDHIDNNPNNNRITNLRVCTSTLNKYNSRRRSDNTSGIKGVHWYKAYQKWQTYIRVEGKTKCLGYFDTLLDASCVVISARNKHHGEFANNGY